MFGVGRCNDSCFGILFKHAAYKLFLEDSSGPEKDL